MVAGGRRDGWRFLLEGRRRVSKVGFKARLESVDEDRGELGVLVPLLITVLFTVID